MQQTQNGDMQRSGEDLFAQLPRRSWVKAFQRIGRSLGEFGAWIFGLIAVTAVVVGFVSSHAVLPVENSKLAASAVVHISPGSTSADIARLLENENMIRDSRAFTVLSRVLRLDDRLQAGDYLFSPGMNVLQIVRHLESGNVVTARVTIPEGVNLRQIASLLAARGLVDPERFLRLARDERLIYGDNPPIPKPTPSLEGYLFPDTYVFVQGQSEEDIIKRMVNRFIEVALPVLAAGPAGSKYSVHELVTLASIIEKEAMLDRERPIISGVFHNRLRIGMPLQSDPTVQYIMDEPRPKLYYSDLAIDSPYNTYKYPGLPPGPISSPGKASLAAVANPADVKYLYFVARGDGTHVFSRTFAEHVRARREVGW